MPFCEKIFPYALNWMMMNKPEILAPAGSRESFMAALAAGADAVYLGLKNFSARMQADNFALRDLAGLTDMAHSENRRVYVAMNTILKPGELEFAGSQLKFLAKNVRPDALIVQDLGVVSLARQAGYEGEIHLSTLANVTHQGALKTAWEMGANRVILPRELSIDEIKSLGDACPEGLDLELFVHGALCFCVSGRCYWSSYMGGKSSLRGQCVQPCRRVYKQGSKESAFFSCLDLSLDVLVKTLLPVKNLVSWKLEGRRKGPHYVYYVTTAYRMMRDNPNDPAVKKDVEELLQMALGRSGTKAGFLPQNEKTPTVAHSGSDETASGLFMGRLSVKKGPGIKEAPQQKTRPGKGKAVAPAEGFNLVLKPWHPLMAGDYFRVGNEDNPWHYTFSIKRAVPKGGALNVMPPKGKFPPAGAPVFLLDRREPELTAAIGEWEEKARQFPSRGGGLPDFRPILPNPFEKARTELADKKAEKARDKESGPLSIILRSSIPQGREGKQGLRPGVIQGLWLTRRTVDEISKTLYGRICWWLPPVIWPNEEMSWRRLIGQAIARGARHFVCNSPWQTAFFKEDGEAARRPGLDLMAGPFCNTSNALALAELARMGFNSAIVSPELAEEDILPLPATSPIPLGVVLSGFWPVGISRHSFAGGKLNEPFTSPKREVFWSRHYGQNLWIYPGWPLDLCARREQLLGAGYRIFIQIDENLPKEVPEPARTTPFNWELGLL